jgi:NAD(P)-dependent dehydrogenase (short-subunit alcohol dehydrogenase family)
MSVGAIRLWHGGLMAVADITTVLITGPTQGLGRETALGLARRGCRLVLLGRPSTRLDDVVDAAARAGAASVHPVEVDMSSVGAVVRAAAVVGRLVAAGTIGRLDAIVANAGVQMSNRTESSVDGYELTFAVNVVANQALLTALASTLTSTAHIVIVGSGTHYGSFPTTALVAAPVWAEPSVLATPGAALPRGRDAASAKAGQCAYSTSKLAVNYLVNELQRRSAPSVRVNVYDPGLMPGTGLARDLSKVKQWAWDNVLPRLVWVIPGAATVKHSASQLVGFVLGDDLVDVRGAYVEIGQLRQPSPASHDLAREEALWQWCDSATLAATAR